MKHYATAYLLTVYGATGRHPAYDPESRSVETSNSPDLALSVAAYQWISSIADGVSALAERVRQRRTQRAVTRELSKLDDHLLSDIGLTRGQIPEVAREMARGASSPCVAAGAAIPAQTAASLSA